MMVADLSLRLGVYNFVGPGARHLELALRLYDIIYDITI
jgi:hypothetical protein